MKGQIPQLRQTRRGKFFAGRTGKLGLAAAVTTMAAFMAIPGNANAATLTAQAHPATAPQLAVTAFSNSPRQQDPAKCQIHYEANEPHLRKSHNHNAVGVKPFVTCNRSVQLIVLNVQMYKYHFFGLLTEKVGPVFTQQSKHNVARFQQLNVAVACTSKASTKWFAVTWGKVLENGKWYFNNGFRSPNRTLGCGT